MAVNDVCGEGASEGSTKAEGRVDRIDARISDGLDDGDNKPGRLGCWLGTEFGIKEGFAENRVINTFAEWMRRGGQKDNEE